MSTFITKVACMWLLKSLISNVVVSSFLLFIFDYLNFWISIDFNNVKDFWIWNDFINLIWVFLILWLIFWIFNSPIKWILKMLSCPINFMTMWLISLFINVLVFYLFAAFSNVFFDWEVVIKLWTIIQTLILSFVMSICSYILKKII